jgi:tetratricopeptide (TPR) repeat protein
MKLRSAGTILAIGLGLVALPAHAQILVSLGDSLAHDCYLAAKFGKPTNDAIAVCSRALLTEALSPSDLAATYDNRGVLENASGDSDAAILDFNKSIEHNDLLGDAYVNRGSVLIRKKQYEAALADINKGLELGVSFPQIGYYDRALAEQAIGQFKDAYYDYQKVLSLEPGFTLASERLKDFTVTTVRQP